MEAEARRSGFDFEAIIRSPAAIPGLIVAVALAVGFWPLIKVLPETWLSPDGYYSHGFLVPLICGYVIYRWWPRLRTIPVKKCPWALLLLAPLLLLTWAGGVADLRSVLSFCLVSVLVVGTWFVAGGRWALNLALPILYLLFALPIWTFAIDIYTAPLQRYSTKVTFFILQITGFSPLMTSSVDISLNHYQFQVAVACSGFKLLIAVSAFTALFILIANLRWKANVAMAALVIPLCLFINGLRVALIGMVGEFGGEGAAKSFHDWSGYITLVVCFFLLFKFARWLGWKD